MIEFKQLNFHRPEEGLIGDCFRTCIGCLLDMPPESVPHFTELGDWKADTSLETQRLLNVWLEQFNLRYIEYPLEATEETLQIYLRHYFPDMYVHVGCSSKHGGHSVIRKNEDYIWDPSKDNSGCVGPMKDGYYWIGLLVHHPK